MIAARVLASEHHAILKVAGQLDTACALVSAGNHVPSDIFDDIADFMDVFLDRYHHGKEENAVFPMLMSRDESMISVLASDHGFMRLRAAKYAAASRLYQPGDGSSSRRLVVAAGQHVDLVRMHINMENTVLLGILRRLSRAEDATVCDAMRRFDAVADMAGRDRVHALVEDIECRVHGAGKLPIQ